MSFQVRALTVKDKKERPSLFQPGSLEFFKKVSMISIKPTAKTEIVKPRNGYYQK